MAGVENGSQFIVVGEEQTSCNIERGKPLSPNRCCLLCCYRPACKKSVGAENKAVMIVVQDEWGGNWWTTEGNRCALRTEVFCIVLVYVRYNMNGYIVSSGPILRGKQQKDVEEEVKEWARNTITLLYANKRKCWA